ncbi:MAG: hypothetical protein WCY09_07495 [Candidatus Omnitrophota bacterium]
MEVLKKKLSKGQSLVQIAILLGLVSMALIVMQTYVKRGIQGKVKDLTDYILPYGQRAYVAESETSTNLSTSLGTTGVSIKSGGGVEKTVNDSATSTVSTTSIGKN